VITLDDERVFEDKFPEIGAYKIPNPEHLVTDDATADALDLAKRLDNGTQFTYVEPEENEETSDTGDLNQYPEHWTDFRRQLNAQGELIFEGSSGTAIIEVDSPIST
jgi:hypothetical protein